MQGNFQTESAELTWAVDGLVHGVDEGEGRDADHEHNQGGEDGPDHLQGGVVGDLLGDRASLGVVELGDNLAATT